MLAGAAVNYFDRFVAIKGGVSRRDAETAALTCVMIASKFLQTKVLSPSKLKELSKLGQTFDDFARTELEVLGTLDWMLAVPTPHGVVAEVVAMLCTGVTEDVRQRLQTHAELIIDLSVFEATLLHLPLGTIAGSALLCSLTKLGSHVMEQRMCELLGVSLDKLRTTAHVRACPEAIDGTRHQHHYTCVVRFVCLLAWKPSLSGHRSGPNMRMFTMRRCLIASPAARLTTRAT